ncbi:MAG: Hsp20/alpha crystallin family protein [Candidatus Marsarchaeota archaeon]|nr:Hsp20/alpha crystallin family protein [Candidatus Marsarchaeota archaeon]
MRRSVLDILEDLEEESEEFMDEVMREMGSLIDQINASSPMMRHGLPQSCIVQRPAHQVYRDDKYFTVVVDLPYVEPGRVNVKIHGRNLKLKALSNRRYMEREICLQLSITLPEDVEVEESNARLSDGVLVIRLRRKGPTEIKID